MVSVKVMWPRTPEERAKGSNKAFIAFATRKEAEDAVMALIGKPPLLVDGVRLQIRWGQPIPADKLARLIEAAGSGSSSSSGTLRGGAAGIRAVLGSVAESPAIRPGAVAPGHHPSGDHEHKAGAGPGQAHAASAGTSSVEGSAGAAATAEEAPFVLPRPPPGTQVVQVPTPNSVWTRRAADLVASYVADVGPAFEQALRQREAALWSPAAVAARAGRVPVEGLTGRAPGWGDPSEGLRAAAVSAAAAVGLGVGGDGGSLHPGLGRGRGLTGGGRGWGAQPAE